MGELNEKQIQAIKAIEQQGKQLNALVEQLLRFAELEGKSSMPQEPHHVKELTAKIANYITQSAKEKDIKINIKAFGDLPCIQINPERITEVFVNLIDNAIKFSDPGTVVTINAFKRDEDFVQVDVIDQGIGIDRKEIDKIFEKFYQIEEYFTGQVKGVGLGLSTVKYVIERHGGQIWVDSKPGVGSTFHFTLPIAKKM